MQARNGHELLIQWFVPVRQTRKQVFCTLAPCPFQQAGPKGGGTGKLSRCFQVGTCGKDGALNNGTSAQLFTKTARSPQAMVHARFYGHIKYIFLSWHFVTPATEWFQKVLAVFGGLFGFFSSHCQTLGLGFDLVMCIVCPHEIIDCILSPSLINQNSIDFSSSSLSIIKCGANF